VPGTDHAAVATESKVENLLIKDEGFKKPKTELGRDAFLDRVKEFAQASHDTIVNQSKKMGASLDWSREAYTFDEIRNKAVRMVFKKMYDDGLIYRGYRVINWSVKGQSTCSDDELEYVERPAKLYYFNYSKECPITIATTRPETKLGDTAIAVNPEGKWKKYIGQTFTIADFGEVGHTLTLKVIADEGVEDAFGTGALGVTPAHSAIDFEMYQKQKALENDIGLIQVIGEDGRMTAVAGTAYAGLTVSEAREKVVSWLEHAGLVEKTEDIVQNVSISDRFKDIVEPLPKVQWFVNVNKKFVLPHSNIDGIKNGQEVTLKELMQQVVASKQIQILPERFEKTYFHWINNLRDWCISRQIWFGHQIPVWYRGEEMFCGVESPSGDGWVQDPDTLDTWFSSGLWTFSTLLNKDFEKYSSLEDWLQNSPDFKNFHPTSVLETGYDILFFWVARMILMTTYTLGTVPFKTVYLHGLVRDEQGRKMSKTLGNIIDPLDMIAKYGTDATRLSLLLGSAPGNDMKLSEEKIAGFRNFANKLWNISRFVLLTIPNPKADCLEPVPDTFVGKWILSKLQEMINVTTDSLEAFNFSYAGEQLRDFTWNELADWYLEIAKVWDDKNAEVLNYVLNTLLKLWHPYMPFVTEAIWQEVYGKESKLMIERWPTKGKVVQVPEFELIKKVITGVRSLRSEYKIEPAVSLPVTLVTKNDWEYWENVEQIIRPMTRASAFRIMSAMVETEKTSTMISFVEGDIEVYIDIGDAVDPEKEKARLEKELAEAEKYVQVLENKLSNQDFVARAPAAVIDGERAKLATAAEKIVKTRAALESLSK
jgi:valyl-tRNA synthetase